MVDAFQLITVIAIAIAAIRGSQARS